MNVNHAAFGTTTLLAVGTIAATLLAATSTHLITAIAFAILGITLGACSIASITAWVNKNDSDSVTDYFNRMYEHMGISIVAVYQFVAQTLVMALVEGIRNGISKAISRKIAGPDYVVTKHK